MNTYTSPLFDRDIQTEIAQLARTLGKPENIVMREVLQAGLKSYHPTPTKGVKALLDLVAWAEENHVTGPRDLSTNHNTYAWE